MKHWLEELRNCASCAGIIRSAESSGTLLIIEPSHSHQGATISSSEAIAELDSEDFEDLSLSHRAGIELQHQQISRIRRPWTEASLTSEKLITMTQHSLARISVALCFVFQHFISCEDGRNECG